MLIMLLLRSVIAPDGTMDLHSRPNSPHRFSRPARASRRPLNISAFSHYGDSSVVGSETDEASDTKQNESKATEVVGIDVGRCEFDFLWITTVRTVTMD